MSLDACAGIVARGDPDRFLSAMTAPLARRGDLLALYAFNVEVSRAPWVTAEPMIAGMRLQWWLDALEELAQGRTPRRHEVFDEIARIVADHSLSTDLFTGLVTARRADVHGEAPGDMAALVAYLEATSGNLMRLAVACLGGGGAADAVAADLGFAQGAANYLAAVPALKAAGRRPLPGPEAQAVAALAGEGRARLGAARARRGEVPRALAPALRAGWRAGPLLARAARNPERVLHEGLGQSEFARRAGLLWRTALGRW